MFVIIDKITNRVKYTIDANHGIQVNENEILQEISNEIADKFLKSYDYELVFQNDKIIDINIIKTWEQWNQEQPQKVPEPTRQDSLNAELLKDNANIQLQLQAQQKLNADLLLKVAQLGGSNNV